MLNGTIIICNYQKTMYGFYYGENKRSTETYTCEIKSQVSYLGLYFLVTV